MYDSSRAEPRPDHSGTLLDLLADLLGAAPVLWLGGGDMTVARQLVENFIGKVVLSETMKSRPEVSRCVTFLG